MADRVDGVDSVNKDYKITRAKAVLKRFGPYLISKFHTSCFLPPTSVTQNFSSPNFIKAYIIEVTCIL